LPDAELDAAVDQLIHLISSKVLDKNTPDKEDTISVNGSTELFCDIFEQLRPGRWMSDEIIMAVMQIVDKPAFVWHGLSIPLDEIVHGQLRAIKRPFANWARQMANYRRVTKETGILVYFCPINHQNNHYSLLEINEPERKIRHFDSLAERARQDRVSSLIKKEFAGLKYSYEEAVSTISKSLFKKNSLANTYRLPRNRLTIGAVVLGLFGISNAWRTVFQLDLGILCMIRTV
jgi:hypothetical protein